MDFEHDCDDNKGHRNWGFTVNYFKQHFDFDVVERIKNTFASARCIRICEHLKDDNDHIHVFIAFEKAVRFNIHSGTLFMGIIERLMFIRNVQYYYDYMRCLDKKVGHIDTYVGEIYAFGELPVNQGKRNDITQVRDMVVAGKSMWDICQQATSYQSIKCAELMMKYRPAQERKVKVHYYWGDTGTGKTSDAIKYAEKHNLTYLKCKVVNGFINGYDGQQVLILDEMRHDSMKLDDLLVLLDPYAYHVNVKGSSRALCATHIFITSPYSPEDLFVIDEDISQFIDRLNEIIHYTGKSYRKKKSKGIV